VTEPPETPSARIIHYTLDKGSDCGLPNVGACVSVGDDEATVVLTLFDASHTFISSFGNRGSFFSPINIAVGFNQCVEVRTRALNGGLSDPIKLCDSTFAALDIHDTDRLECSSDGLKPLAPSPNYVPLSAPPVGALTDGTSDQPAAHDAGVQQADAQVADAEGADASPVRYIKGKTPGSGGCRAAQHGSPVPLAWLLLSLLALRRRRMVD
jgi:uncharacterized protein (TIGR03382 family)